MGWVMNTKRMTSALIFFCFVADELRPFPEEWYQHGYMESNERPGTVHYMYDEEPNGTAPPDDTWVPRWEDDRMGIMDHPHRGTLYT